MTGRVFELDGVRFGADQPVAVETFDRGAAEWRTQDAPEPMGDGVVFGRDYLGGPLWSWTMFTDAYSPTEALTMLSVIEGVWRNRAGRRVPGEVQRLLYTVAGRTRAVYGRPRRFTAPLSDELDGGIVPITADFQCADARTYSVFESSVAVPLYSASRGGFSFPTSFPLRWSAVGTRTAVAEVGGDASAWCTVRIRGPVRDPVVSAGDWSVALSGVVPQGRTVVVSARPWDRGGRWEDDGSSAAPLLTRRTRLSRLLLDPGRHPVTFSGADATSSASAEVSWFDAYNSL